MNVHINLQPLPDDVVFGSTQAERLIAYAVSVALPYQQRATKAEAQLEAIGAGGITQGQPMMSGPKLPDTLYADVLKDLLAVKRWIEGEVDKHECLFGPPANFYAKRRAGNALDLLQDAIKAMDSIQEAV